MNLTRAIWYGISYDDRVAIAAGNLQQFPSLHRIWRVIQAEDAEQWVRNEILQGNYLTIQ